MIRRRPLTVVALAAALLTLTAAVQAYWTSMGNGSGTAQVATLDAPTGVSGSASGSTVTVSWTPPASPSGNTPDVTFSVQRWSGGAATYVCATSATVHISGSSCADTGVASGSYTYTVTAHFGSWSTTSAASGTVSVASAATKLAITTSPVSVEAGIVSDPISVQRQSSSGAAVTGGVQTIHLTTTSATGTFRDASGTGTVTSVTIADGDSSASFRYHDTKAGTWTIKAADQPDATDTGLTDASQTATVTPGAAASFSLAASTTTPVAGSNVNLTVTALDTHGNTATAYTGDRSLTFSGATAIGTFTPTVTDKDGTERDFGEATNITFTDGVSTVSGPNNGVMRLYRAGTSNITVTAGSLTNGSGLAVTVAAKAPSHLALAECSISGSATTCSSTFELGNSGTLTAWVETVDEYGNATLPPADVTIQLSLSGDGSLYSFATDPDTTETVTVTSPANRSSSSFSVFKRANSAGSSTVTGSATGFSDLVFTVKKN